MPELAAQSALVLDYGAKRIGAALALRVTHTATPLATLTNDGAVWTQLDRLVKEYAPQAIVLGMPTHNRETPHPLVTRIERFGAEVGRRYGLDVRFVNEALSSYEANERLKQQRQLGRRRKVEKGELDQQAAAILAESWLDNP